MTERGLDLSFELYVGRPVILDVRLTDASAVSPRESATVAIQGVDENTPIMSDVVILDGKLYLDYLKWFGLPIRPWVFPHVLSPGVYSVSLTTAGQEFVGTLSVPERGEPDEAIVVYCSPR